MHRVPQGSPRALRGSRGRGSHTPIQYFIWGATVAEESPSPDSKLTFFSLRTNKSSVSGMCGEERGS